MRITDYLDAQSQYLSESSRHVKNFHVFDFNYIPEEPLMRDEVKPVVDACLRYIQSRIANHVFIFGSRGSGKTLTVRYLQRMLRQRHNVHMLYVNCRQFNTSYKVLAHLLGVRPRGNSLDELWHRLTTRYKGRLILVLDEVDLLSDKDRSKDLLYLLGRSPDNYMTIMLSNHPRFLRRLDESIRSSLQPMLVHFRNYDAHNVFSILKDRANAGLHCCDDGVLSEISAMTVSATNSDVRVAIKTLYHVATTAGAEVQHVFDQARRDLTRDVLADLNEKNIMILQAAASAPESVVKQVYKRYRQLSASQQQEPISYVYFYSNLSYLQSVGLILLLSTKVGRTYTNRIQLLFDQELLALE